MCDTHNILGTGLYFAGRPEEASKGWAWITVWAAANSAQVLNFTKYGAVWTSLHQTAVLCCAEDKQRQRLNCVSPEHSLGKSSFRARGWCLRERAAPEQRGAGTHRELSPSCAPLPTPVPPVTDARGNTALFPARRWCHVCCRSPKTGRMSRRHLRRALVSPRGLIA